MKRKILIFFIFTSIKIFAQTPVIDFAAIGTAIENGVTMYNQLQQCYNQTIAMVEELNTIKKDLESFDVSKYDWSKWDAILKMTDHYMTQQDRIASIINTKNMRIGNLNFSLKDLFTTDLYENLLDESEKQLNPYNMTEAQKTSFMQKHGLSPAHYYRLQNVSTEMSKKAQEVKAKIEDDKEQHRLIEEQIKNFTEDTDKISGNTEGISFLAKQINLTMRMLDDISQNITTTTDAIVEYYSYKIEEAEEELQFAYRTRDWNVKEVEEYMRNRSGTESETYGPGKVR